VGHRYVNFGWTYSEVKREDALKLVGERRMMRQPWTYAGTESYIVEINALARLWDSNSNPSDWKVANMRLLKQRIEEFGFCYEAGDPRGHPAYTGALINQTRTPRLGLSWEIKWPRFIAVVRRYINQQRDDDGPADPTIDQPLILPKPVELCYGSYRR
jgi:hypothetical protein